MLKNNISRQSEPYRVHKTTSKMIIYFSFNSTIFAKNGSWTFNL